MGNQPQILRKEQLQSDHPLFRNANIIEQSQKTYIQSKFPIQAKEYDQWYKFIQFGEKGIKSQFIMLPQQTNFKNDQGLCGTTGTLTLNFPCHPYLLSNIIRQRNYQKKMFKESQLWYMLYALVQAKHQSQAKSQKFGDIKPGNILVSQQGKLRVVSVFTWPGQRPSYLKANDQIQLNKDYLLAPQDFQQLQKGAFNNTPNPKSQIFAIGATVLSAGILSNLSEVYNYKAKSFDLNVFKTLKRRWVQEKKYSDIFKNNNPEERLSSGDLFNFVTEYKQAIIQKQHFVITRPPQKIQRAYHALKTGKWQ